LNKLSDNSSCFEITFWKRKISLLLINNQSVNYRNRIIITKKKKIILRKKVTMGLLLIIVLMTNWCVKSKFNKRIKIKLNKRIMEININIKCLNLMILYWSRLTIKLKRYLINRLLSIVTRAVVI